MKKPTHGAYPAYSRLPRKLKKKLPKLYHDMNMFMWKYRRDIVNVRNMRVIILYPLIANDRELNNYYKLNYPENIGKQQLCFSKRTQVIYPPKTH